MTFNLGLYLFISFTIFISSVNSGSNEMAQSQTSIIMRILAASIKVANRAGSIIRDVMSKGDLGIVEKVNYVRQYFVKEAKYFIGL